MSNQANNSVAPWPSFEPEDNLIKELVAENKTLICDTTENLDLLRWLKDKCVCLATHKTCLYCQCSQELKRWQSLYKDSQNRLDMVDSVAIKAAAERDALGLDLLKVQKECISLRADLRQCHEDCVKARAQVAQLRKALAGHVEAWPEFEEHKK